MSQPNQETCKLNTGAKIPAIGLGTWQDNENQEDAVLASLGLDIAISTLRDALLYSPCSSLDRKFVNTSLSYGIEPAVGIKQLFLGKNVFLEHLAKQKSRANPVEWEGRVG